METVVIVGGVVIVVLAVALAAVAGKNTRIAERCVKMAEDGSEGIVELADKGWSQASVFTEAGLEYQNKRLESDAPRRPAAANGPRQPDPAPQVVADFRPPVADPTSIE